MDTTLALYGLAILVVALFAAIQFAVCFLRPIILKLLPMILFFAAYFIAANIFGKPAMYSASAPGLFMMRASPPMALLGVKIGWVLHDSFIKNI